MNNTEKRLAAIRARYNEVSRFPWFMREEHGDYFGRHYAEYQIWDRNSWERKLDPIATLDMCCGQEEAAKFISGAHRDIPFLLGLIEHQNAELERLGAYEDAKMSPARVQELAAAEREGRLTVRDKCIPQNTDFGLVVCRCCHAGLECDENGDMPDDCPDCGCMLDWDMWVEDEAEAALAKAKGDNEQWT